MKKWNFTFTDVNGAPGNYGWNTVCARGKKSATKKAEKKLRGFNKNYRLNPESLNTSEHNYRMLMMNFY